MTNQKPYPSTTDADKEININMERIITFCHGKYFSPLEKEFITEVLRLIYYTGRQNGVEALKDIIHKGK